MTRLSFEHRNTQNQLCKIISYLYLAVSLGYLALVILAFIQDLSWLADFTMFYTGSSIVRQGLGDQLYNFDLQQTVQHKILSGYPHGDGILAFNYPPHVALIFYPVSFLPLKAAYVLWFVAQIVTFISLAFMLWQQTVQAGWSHRERILLLTAITALPSMLVALMLGTVSLFILLCIIGLYNAVKHNRHLEAATWLVLGSIKPHFILFPALALLFSRRWRVISYAVLMMSVIVLLSSSILGWNVWLDFFSAVSSTYREGSSLGVTPSSMLNFRGALAVLLSPEKILLVDNISLVGFIIASLLTVILWVTLGTKKQIFDLIFGLTILIGILFGLHVHPQDGLFIVPPAYLLYNHVRNNGYQRKMLSILLLLCPVVFLIYRYTTQASIGISAQVILMLILLVWIIAYIIKSLRINRLNIE